MPDGKVAVVVGTIGTWCRPGFGSVEVFEDDRLMKSGAVEVPLGVENDVRPIGDSGFEASDEGSYMLLHGFV